MSWNQVFEQFKQKQIVVIGDIMLDKYLYGKVDRISPEAPVPILQLNRAERRIGGAGNVALNLAGLGAKAYIFAAIGEDMEGDNLLGLLKAQDLSETGIFRLPDFLTTIKTRLIGGTQQLMRVDEEQYRELTDEEQDIFLERLESLITNASIDGLILQDYNKGLLSKSVIEAVLNLANKHDLPVAVDPKFANFTTYSPVTIFKPNLRELEAALGYPVSHADESLLPAIMDLRRMVEAEWYSITLSEHGMYLAGPKGDRRIPTRKRNVVDVCGAGDAVISALMLGYLAGCGQEETGTLANAAGGYVCETVGVVPAVAEKILDELTTNN
jgi:rfaE bifunctional protein kinase chain/domain